EDVFVLGVSRSVNESLQNQEQYEHIAVDLVEDGGVNTVMEAVEAISKKAEWNQLYVVNNAAMLEPVGFAHTLETEQIKSHYMLNVFVPMALTAACIRLA